MLHTSHTEGSSASRSKTHDLEMIEKQQSSSALLAMSLLRICVVRACVCVCARGGTSVSWMGWLSAHVQILWFACRGRYP